MSLRDAFAVLPAIALMAVAACATEPTPTSGEPLVRGERLLVRTAADWPDAAAFAERAASVAGVAVHDVRAVAPRQFAFLLACDDATICQAALRRLTADHDLVLDVQVNQRRRLPSRPSPSTAQ
jgi:hypothetical protein